MTKLLGDAQSEVSLPSMIYFGSDEAEVPLWPAMVCH